MCQVSSRLKKTVLSLGNTTAELLSSAGKVATNPEDVASKRELLTCTKAEQEKVSIMMLLSYCEVCMSLLDWKSAHVVLVHQDVYLQVNMAVFF